jgi:hypothetical protein
VEHILNCHGEWMFALQALAALPVIGVWFRALRHSHKHESKP